MNLVKRVGARVGLGGLVFASSALPALADGFTLDPAPVLAIIATCLLFIIAVGTAVLGLVYTARGFKWARKAG